MNKNFTIPVFAEPITGLPDTPTCAAAELKRRFQAPADEVREAHNALAEAHETLDEKVEGIVTETFAGTIHESMFDESLAEKLNGKADESDVTKKLAAETAAREELAARVAAAESTLPQKSEAYFGTYTGTGTYPRTISLGFTPQAVIIGNQNGLVGQVTAAYCALMVKGQSTNLCSIVTNGFTLYEYQYSYLNSKDSRFFYIAFK